MGMLLSLFKGIVSESGRVQPTVKEKQAETDALRKLWRRGQGAPVNGIAIDYSFYSPVEHGADPAKKYPLVIIMAGALEGVVPGFELTANALAYWTAPHIQQRFPNGGAYLLIGRAPEEKKLYWDSTKLTAPFKAAIDGFIAANENVDTQRIYSIGWCLGGTGSLNLAAGYPGFFAAAIVITPSRPFSHTEARRLANTPFWLMGCKADNYVSYRGIVQKSQRRLNRCAKDPAHKLLTSCENAPDVFLAEVITFIQNHDMWDTLAEDMRPDKPTLTGLVTENGAGNAVETPQAVKWLTSFTAPPQAEPFTPCKRDLAVRLYERFEAPRRANLLLALLHVLDRRGFIDLYPKKKKKKKNP